MALPIPPLFDSVARGGRGALEFLDESYPANTRRMGTTVYYILSRTKNICPD